MEIRKERAFGRQHQFYYSFQPAYNHLMHLVGLYQKEILEWSNNHSKQVNALEAHRDELNKQAQLRQVSGMEWSALDREMENLQREKGRKVFGASELVSRIDFETGSLFGLWPEIESDYNDQYMLTTEFIDFLSKYNVFIKVMNDINFKSHKQDRHCQSILNAITKHLTQTIAA